LARQAATENNLRVWIVPAGLPAVHRQGNPDNGTASDCGTEFGGQF